MLDIGIAILLCATLAWCIVGFGYMTGLIEHPHEAPVEPTLAEGQRLKDRAKKEKGK